MDVRWNKNLEGGTIKVGGGGRISKCYKPGRVPMVKIKDFTLASKNRGGGHVLPSVPYTPPACVRVND